MDLGLILKAKVLIIDDVWTYLFMDASVVETRVTRKHSRKDIGVIVERSVQQRSKHFVSSIE